VLSEVRVAADGSGFKDGEVIEQVTTRAGGTRWRLGE
jgi:hypothetical protein